MPSSQKLRELAANLAVGWEEYTDPRSAAFHYGQAFREAARRIYVLLAEEGFDEFTEGERRIMRHELP